MFVRESAAPDAKEKETKWLSRSCAACTVCTCSAWSLSRCTFTWRSVAPAPTCTSVTAFVSCRTPASPTQLSTTAPLAPRSATIRLRRCATPSCAPASDAKSRCTGVSGAASAAKCTTAPSCAKAVLSAVKACASYGAMRVRCRSISAGISRQARASSITRTPAPASRRERSAR